MTIIAKDIQANIGRSTKPDWQMYLFFRVMNQSEQEAYLANIPEIRDKLKQSGPGDDIKPYLESLLSGKDANLTGNPSESFFKWLNNLLQKISSSADDLTSILEKITEDFQPYLLHEYDNRTAILEALKEKPKDSGFGDLLDRISSTRNVSDFGDFGTARSDDSYNDIFDTLPSFAPKTQSGTARVQPMIEIPSDFDSGTGAVKSGLVGVLLQILKNNLASNPKFTEGVPHIRSEVEQDLAKEQSKSDAAADQDDDEHPVRSVRTVNAKNTETDNKIPPPPVNIGFTAPGLEFIGVDENLVATFPDVFRDGMAKRAERLFDTGPSAPEHWEGALGQRHVHGVVWSSFPAPDVENLYWELLRDEVRAFNAQGKNSEWIRCLISFLFRLIGIDILHIELGENAALNDTPIEPPKYTHYRLEHFGFRDGVSQPFVDMGLKAPALGGGNPSRLNSWEPVAPGEIFLGHKDQDGKIDSQPAMPDLRNNGTYMVFRKLEQDVVGFREFIRNQYPGETKKQDLLKAQMMGRWPNGTSLVDAPTTETLVEESQINNFRFLEQDPDGSKCPLGAHIRRANPRDIGERDSVKRHRMLRRSMSFGGPILAQGSKDTTQKKGLLFVAINSRIDLQFELVQSRWLNGGEFLGQAGLDKCPMTGANNGTVKDRFHEAGGLSPVTGIPRFVTTKGGDYFFIPGLEALRKLAKRHFNTKVVREFIQSEESILDKGDAAGRPRSKGIFDKERLTKIGMTILASDFDAVKVTPRGEDIVPLKDSILFFGKYDHVTDILNGKDDSGKCVFSADHYYEAGKILTRGDAVILGLDSGRSKAMDKARAEMINILSHAWYFQGATIMMKHAKDDTSRGKLKGLIDNWKPAIPFRQWMEHVPIPACKFEEALAGAVRKITQIRTNVALQRVAPSGHIDLCQDFATDAAYSVIAALYGVRGPNHVTELAMALPFAKLNVGAVHPDWLAALRGKKPSHPDVLTTQVWAVTNFVSLVGNIEERQGLKTLSRKAGSELLNHLDDLYERTVLQKPKYPENLLQAFVVLEDGFVKGGMSRDTYRAHARSLLAELIVSTLALIPSTFGRLVYKCFEEDISVPEVVTKLMNAEAIYKSDPDYKCEYGYREPSNLRKFIYEMDRLEPSLSVLLRRCEKETELGSVIVKKGQWVGALIGAANMDRKVFKNPSMFALPDVPGFKGPASIGKKDRLEEKYLMFGAPIGKGEHSCWGRYRIALNVIEELFSATSRLQGLRRVAGPSGEPFKFAGVTVGLKARFAAFQPGPSGGET